MSTQDKRRSAATGAGAGAAGGHILRAGGGPRQSATTGSSTHTAAASSTSRNNSRSRDDTREKDGSGEGLPAMPPKAAVPTASASTPEEPMDGGVPLLEKDKENTQSSGKSKDGTPYRSERDIHHHHHHHHHGGGTGSGSSSPNRAGRSSSGGGGGGGGFRTKTRDHHATQLLLRERDDRIASLEKELSVMEREFQRELDKLSQNESETATFWQSKHSALHQQFLRTDTELRLLRSEVDVREAERDELRQGWEVMRRQMRERDEEIRGLRGQVRGLKEFVSTSTRTDGQMSDEVFGDGMARLGNGLQNWVINNFRKAKMNLTNVDQGTAAEMADLVPMYEELAATSKVYLLQSVVSSIFVDMVFSSYYPGLSEEQTSQFRKMEELLREFAESDETVNQWRSSTLALIRREASHRQEGSSSSADTDDAGAFTEKVVTRINRVLNAITTSSTQGDARDSALRALVDSAVDLARLLAVQKAVLRAYFPPVLPHQRVPFDPDTMEDIGGEDEDEDGLAGREISCVAFPGVIKHGDESGAQLQFRNVICRARVLCRPEEG